MKCYEIWNFALKCSVKPQNWERLLFSSRVSPAGAWNQTSWMVLRGWVWCCWLNVAFPPLILWVEHWCRPSTTWEPTSETSPHWCAQVRREIAIFGQPQNSTKLNGANQSTSKEDVWLHHSKCVLTGTRAGNDERDKTLWIWREEKLIEPLHHNGKTRYIHCSWTRKLGIQEPMFGAMVYLGSSFGLWSALVPQLNSHDRCPSAMFCQSHWCWTIQEDQYRHKDAKIDPVCCIWPHTLLYNPPWNFLYRIENVGARKMVHFNPLT